MHLISYINNVLFAIELQVSDAPCVPSSVEHNAGRHEDVAATAAGRWLQGPRCILGVAECGVRDDIGLRDSDGVRYVKHERLHIHAIAPSISPKIPCSMLVGDTPKTGVVRAPIT
eukprot:m.414826 g.414826  ORF g.414826 m.414826 type:complete len:115 (+) comp21275_c1_seq2:3530-3874(+)